MKRVLTSAGLLIACAAWTACEATIAPQPITGMPSTSANPRPVAPPAAPIPSATSRALFNPADATNTARVRSVTVHADVTGAQGPVAIVEELIAPNGEPYQRREETLFGSPGDVQGVDFELPVAGTLIHQKQLTGTWTARLSVSGVAVATQTFELQP